MPLQQIAVLSPKNLMVKSSGKQTQEQTDTENHVEGVNSDNLTENNEDVDEHQAEAALETHVTIKTGARGDESSDTSTEGGTDSQDNGTAHPDIERDRNGNQTQTTDTRSGKRTKKEKLSPVKKKDNLTQVMKHYHSYVNINNILSIEL